MVKFITGKAVLAQDEFLDNWITLHNQLFQDKDGNLYFVPRFFKTDGYTIPNYLAFIGGSKMEYDLRPAIQHDFECKYHKVIMVTKTLDELIDENYVKEITKNDTKITICEDIPIEYLKVKDTTFNQANNRFKRALKSLGQIKPWRINLMRFAVNFNISWAFSKKELELEKFYKTTI